MSPGESTAMFLSLGVLLGAARLLGEVAKRFQLPSVLGEIMAGVLLGPTVLGALAPRANAYLFPTVGSINTILQGFSTVAAAMFLLVAGLEVDLSAMRRQGRAAVAVSISGILIPFTLGFLTAWLAPRAMGREVGADPLIFALFFATALSISALPVIARTLLDIGMFRTDLGMVVIASAIFQDLVGWMIFAVVLGMMTTTASHGLPVPYTIGLTIGFAVLMLTIVRRLLHAALPWIQAFTSWPGGVLGFVAMLGLLCAAFTEWIGIHAIFGAFMAGVALGDSKHLHRRTRATLDQFVSFVFAPIFFASIGLRVDFIGKFHVSLVATVFLVACLGKIVGCGLGARLSGMGVRESLAVGFGMNARGAMEIILALLALQYGIIRERMFVALVVTALVTSVMSGPAIQWILRRKTPHRLTQHVALVKPLAARTAAEAISELCAGIAGAAGLAAAKIEEAVLAREAMMPTGLECGIAVPHAPMKGLASPVVAVGILRRDGVDFGAMDGHPSHLIFLLLTPDGDQKAQLEILADIAKTFTGDVCRRALHVSSLPEFLALAKAEAPAEAPEETERT